MSSFVIAALDLAVLNHMNANYPRPIALEWINRATNRKIRPGTIDVIMRTLYQPMKYSESVQRIHSTSGLRVIFASEADRLAFAAAFRAAAQKCSDPPPHRRVK